MSAGAAAEGGADSGRVDPIEVVVEGVLVHPGLPAERLVEGRVQGDAKLTVDHSYGRGISILVET